MMVQQFFVNLVNRANLPCTVMNYRPLVRRYFDWKYRKEDPYGVLSRTRDTRYQEMLNLLPYSRYAKALDVGCGEGAFCEMLLAVCDRVTGIDISTSAIQRAQQKYESWSRLEFTATDILHASLTQDYDLIVCAEILYYLNRKQLRILIPRLTEWLLPGGHLMVGNIKQIRSAAGFFRSHIRGDELNNFFINYETFAKASELDRGSDVVTLFRKRV